MKILRITLLVLLAVIVALQFFRPEKNIDTTDHLAAFYEETNPDPQVRNILKESCFDCHSNNTRYPWYSNVAPISFWLKSHIDEGKSELNFSEWGTYSQKKKDHKLEEIAEAVTEGYMPLKSYTVAHSEARLDQEQISAIVEWTVRTRKLYQLGNLPN